MPRRHDAEPAMPLKRVIERDVVDADNAEDCVNADPLEFFQESVGNCDFVCHGKTSSIADCADDADRRLGDVFASEKLAIRVIRAIRADTGSIKAQQELSNNLIKLLRLLDVTKMPGIRDDL